MPNEQTTVPLFVASEVLTAADMNLSAGTGVPVFSNTTTRDAGFGGAGEKVLAEGQLCYLSSTNVVQYYDGAAWATVGPASASALTLIKSQTIGSGVTSVAVTGAFSATYDAYKITVTGGTGSANSNINMVLGSTTTGYYWCSVSAGFDGTGPYSAGAENISSFVATGLSQTSTLTLNLDVLAPYLSKITTVMGARTGAVGGSGGAYYGFQNSTTSFTDFTLSPTSGTLTGGTVRVYGYSNS